MLVHQNQCQNQKNTIDPEKIIKLYGADAVRLFILSDSPPEKDIQWSDTGISASYKFLQKLWVLNEKIVSNKKQFTKFDEDLEKFTNQIIKKFDEDLNRFGFNVVIASIYKIYSFYSKQINKEDWGSNFYKNYTNILEIINPIIPHFSNECLEKLNHSIKNIKWPSTNKKYLEEDTFQIVTQVNGKKRKVFSIDRSIDKETIINDIKNDDQIKKYLNNKKIIKTINIEKKLINFIIQ